MHTRSPLLLGLMLLLGLAAPANAAIEKFVYAFAADGTPLAPTNAAARCPVPGTATAGAPCKGVAVASNGDYSLTFSNETLSSNKKLTLLANEYEHLASGDYVLLDSKRRGELIHNKEVNTGVDISQVSEAGVRAVEKAAGITAGPPGQVSKEVAESIAATDIATLNDTLGIGATTNTEGATTNPLLESNQNQLDATALANLQELADLAVQYSDDAAVQELVKKNVEQGLLVPDFLAEAKDRTFTHVAQLETYGADAPIMVLDADKYVLATDQSALLTTTRSVNPAAFFGYTWMGVESETSQATFSRAEEESYLVCVSGETDAADALATDCVRMRVRGAVEAITSASTYRTPTNSTVNVLGSASINATVFRWSGPGNFANQSIADTLWSAPATPGTYALTLTVDDGATDSLSIEVYDVLPLARGEAQAIDADTGFSAALISHSTSTDGTAVDRVTWTVSSAPTGATYSIIDANSSSARLNSNTQGSYALLLTAEKGAHSNQATVEVRLRDTSGIIAHAGPDRVAYRNQTVKLDASLTAKLSTTSATLNYRWALGNGVAAMLGDTNAVEPAFVANAIGDYTATLTVSDGRHTLTDTAVVSVRNRIPVAFDEWGIDATMNAPVTGRLRAYDGDNDPLTYILLTQPANGSVTVDPVTGDFTYLHGGEKACRFHPYAQPSDNDQGGRDVPVIKLCADKFYLQVGEVATLTTSNSIAVTKFSSFRWVGVTSSDPRTASFSSTTPGTYKVCIVGNVAQSRQTSTACVELVVGGSGGSSGSTSSPGNSGNSRCDEAGRFQFKVNDGMDDSNIANVVLTVGCENTPPVANAAIVSTTEEQPVSGILSATDVNPQTLSFHLGRVPSRGQVTITNPVTGAFTYTPNANVFGEDSFTFTAYDGVTHSTAATITIQISGTDDAPTAQYDGRITTPEDVPVNGVLRGSDLDGEALRFTVVNAPRLGSVAVDATTGAFVYTPNPQLNGEDTFTYTVHDGHRASSSATVPVLITPIDDAPVANNVGPSFVNPGETLVGTLSATDVDSSPLRYALVTLPTKGTVLLSNPSTGAFAYAPRAGNRGTDTFTYHASDATQNSNIATVTILINGANEPPIAYSAGPLQGSEDQALTGRLTAGDPDDDPLTYILINTGSIGAARITDAKSGAFVYTPNANVNGTESITFKVNDGFVDSAPATVTLAIAPVNDQPLANNATHSVHVNEILRNTISGSDIDNDALVYRVTSQPTKGALVVNATTGAFQYTPQGALGQDSFRFVTDDGKSVSAAGVVTISVTAINQAPTIDDMSVSVMAGQSVESTVAGRDPEGAALSYQLVTAPLSGQVAITNNVSGAFRYTAAPGTTGGDYFTVIASDGAKTSTIATVGVNIVNTAALCRSRGVAIADTDGDGYSDFVEQILGTAFDNASNTPVGLAPNAFNLDSDADSYVDVKELWLGTDPFNAASVHTIPVTSLSECFTTQSDVLPPVLKAWHVLPSDSDPDTGAPRMHFAFTALDNASGVASVSVVATSPSGVTKTATVTRDDHPLLAYGVVSFSELGIYAEAGTWTVDRITLVDAVGNKLELSRFDMTTMGCTCTVSITNTNSDLQTPELTNFTVLTTAINLAVDAPTASFTIQARDTVSGIVSANVTLRSPSGALYRWASYATDTSQATININVTTNALPAYAEAGTWQVVELLLSDAAGRELRMDRTALVGWGCVCNVVVSNVAADSTAPQLINLQVLTPRVDISAGGAVAKFGVTVNDGGCGMRDIDVTLQSPSGEIVRAHHSNSSGNGQVTATLLTDAFTPYVETGNWRVTELAVRDRNGNAATWSTADLTALNLPTTVELYIPTWRCCSANHAPEATSTRIRTTEDTPVTSSMTARDADGDMLMFELVSQGTLGTVRITNPEAGGFVYTPNANANGTDTFSFRASDARANSNVAQVTVTIDPANDKPIANALTFEVIQDHTFNGQLSGVDAENTPLQFSLVTQGTNGVATINANGSFTYTPTTGAMGTDSFTFVVSDGVATSDPATVTVQIAGEFRLLNFQVLTPVISALDELVTVSAAVTLSADIATLSNVSLTARLPGQQAFSMSQSISIGSRYPIIITRVFDTRYSPLSLGTWEFAELFVNVVGRTQRSWVAKDIEAAGFDPHFRVVANRTPVAVTDRTINVVLGATFTGTLGATDADNDALTFRVVENGTKGIATITDSARGSFRYIAQSVGTDIVTYRANDGKTDSNIGRITVNVTRNNGAPVAYAGSIIANKDTAYIGSLVGSDADNDPLTFSIVEQGLKGTVTLTDIARGAFVYRPTRGALGSDSFAFKVRDGQQDSTLARVTVTIVETDKAPVANAQAISVFQNVAYQGTLSGSDQDGDTLAFALVNSPTLGNVVVNSTTGRFTYTPQTGRYGSDSFTFRVTANGVVSNGATVTVTVLSLGQICGSGGAIANLDTDHDGYSDAIERMFRTALNNAAETPAGLNADTLGIRMNDDDDVDGYPDYVEVWLSSDAADAGARPSRSEITGIPACFNALSDGIKPRLLAFTPVRSQVNVGDGSAVVRYAMTVADNASGVRVARVNLLSPSGVLLTSFASLSDLPLLRGFELSTTALGPFAEAGVWHVVGVTLYDAAGNRLTLDEDDLLDAGFGTTVDVSNANGDATPPRLVNFAITTPSVNLSSGDTTLQFSVSATDVGAGLGSLRIDLRGPTGVIVSARYAFTGAPSSATVNVATPILSDYAQAGSWSVASVLLVDAAGNSVERASQLLALGFANTITVVNAYSDSTPPALDGLTILTPELYPATGSARMSFAVDVSDNTSGVATIRIDIRGPSGQYLTAWGDLSANPSVATTVQLDTAIVSELLEEGVWLVDSVTVIDEAGNTRTFYPEPAALTVRYN